MSGSEQRRRAPWYAISGQLPEYASTRTQIAVAAGLDWKVATFPVEVPLPSGKRLLSETQKGIVKTSDETLLSIMGANYSPRQPSELVDLAFDVLEEVNANTENKEPFFLFDSGFSLAGGRVNMLICRIPRQAVISEMCPVSLYIAFITSHDGSLKFGTRMLPVTGMGYVTLNTKLKNAEHEWSLKHTASGKNSDAEILRTIRLINQYAGAFQVEMDHLARTPFTLKQFEQMVHVLFPKSSTEPAPFSREQYSLIGSFNSSPTIEPGHRFTKFGALLAVAEFFNWHTRFNQGGAPADEKRVTHVILGASQKNVERTFRYLS